MTTRLTSADAREPPEPLQRILAGRYRLERELGHGGMATVYRAEDLKHGRPVAVKVLRPELAAAVGAERFLREIAVTATLHHPHILALHDSGEADRVLYYVMPLVDGESLRDRLVRERQLPVEEAVRIAAQVAGALDYAHRHGVVHRDLKPENILLQDGEALVADFGVARAVQRASDTSSLTSTGVMVGTPAYMSPEQAAGDKELDGRSDVFSLGTVLYEMLAGAQPFAAPTAQGVIARVIAEEPRPLAAARPSVPRHVEHAVRRALAKVPADRWATAHAFADALQGGGAAGAGAGAFGSGATAAESAAQREALSARVRRARLRDPLVVALVAMTMVAVLALGAAVWSWRLVRSAPAPAAVRLALPLPAGVRLTHIPGSPVVMAPDGRAIVYGASAPGAPPMLYYRRLAEMRSRPLPGTEGARSPFFSPDGQWVGFFAGGTVAELRKVPVGGGSAVTLLASAPGSVGAAWGPRGVIVGGSPQGLWRVSAGGGTPAMFTRVAAARGETTHGGPRFLPDGETVAFTIYRGADPDSIGLASAATGRLVVLDASGRNVVGFVDGQLIIGGTDGVMGTIAAVPLDLRRWRVTGPAVTVLEEVATKTNGGVEASLAGDGSLAYVHGSAGSRLALVDARGTVIGGLEATRGYSYPSVSPDGRRIAVGIWTSGVGGVSGGSGATVQDIWIYDVAAGTLSRLTSRVSAFSPAWTPDGRRVAYVAAPGGRWGELWWVPADGSGPAERLYSAPASSSIQQWGPTFTPDGRVAVFGALNAQTQIPELWQLPLAGATADRRATPLLQESPFGVTTPRLSPDGRWLAYASNETGRYEIYVRPFRGRGGRVQVSVDGGRAPVWAPDGRRLFYQTSPIWDGNLIVASLATAPTPVPTLAVTGRAEVFPGAPAGPVGVASRGYDVLPNGKGFAVLKPVGEGAGEIMVVLNWREELRARIAGRSGR